MQNNNDNNIRGEASKFIMFREVDYPHHKNDNKTKQSTRISDFYD